MPLVINNESNRNKIKFIKPSDLITKEELLALVKGRAHTIVSNDLTEEQQKNVYNIKGYDDSVKIEELKEK